MIYEKKRSRNPTQSIWSWELGGIDEGMLGDLCEDAANYSTLAAVQQENDDTGVKIVTRTKLQKWLSRFNRAIPDMGNAFVRNLFLLNAGSQVLSTELYWIIPMSGSYGRSRLINK